MRIADKMLNNNYNLILPFVLMLFDCKDVIRGLTPFTLDINSLTAILIGAGLVVVSIRIVLATLLQSMSLALFPRLIPLNSSL